MLVADNDKTVIVKWNIHKNFNIYFCSLFSGTLDVKILSMHDKSPAQGHMELNMVLVIYLMGYYNYYQPTLWP